MKIPWQVGFIPSVCPSVQLSIMCIVITFGLSVRPSIIKSIPIWQEIPWQMGFVLSIHPALRLSIMCILINFAKCFYDCYRSHNLVSVGCIHLLVMRLLQLQIETLQFNMLFLFYWNMYYEPLLNWIEFMDVYSA